MSQLNAAYKYYKQKKHQEKSTNALNSDNILSGIGQYVEKKNGNTVGYTPLSKRWEDLYKRALDYYNNEAHTDFYNAYSGTRNKAGYVSDTGTWYSDLEGLRDTANKDVDALLAELDQYSRYYNPDAVSYVRDLITKRKSSYDDMMKDAGKFRDHWSQWATEDDYNAAVWENDFYKLLQEGKYDEAEASISAQMDTFKQTNPEVSFYNNPEAWAKSKKLDEYNKYLQQMRENAEYKPFVDKYSGMSKEELQSVLEELKVAYHNAKTSTPSGADPLGLSQQKADDIEREMGYLNYLINKDSPEWQAKVAAAEAAAAKQERIDNASGWERSGAWLADTANNALYAPNSMVEGAADFVNNGYVALGDAINMIRREILDTVEMRADLRPYANRLKQDIEKWNEDRKGYIDTIQYDWAMDLSNLNEDQYIYDDLSWLSDYPELQRQFNGMIQGVAGMAPAILAAPVTGGTSLSWIPSAYMTLGAAGGATNEALDAGNSPLDAAAYGTAIGALEYGSEMIGGSLFGGATELMDTPIGRLIVKHGADKFFGKGVGKAAYTFASEGFEESIMDIATPLAQSAFGIGNSRDKYFGDNWEKGWKEVISGIPETFVVGGTVGAIVEGFHSGASAIANRDKGGFKYNKIADEMTIIENALKSQEAVGQSTNANQKIVAAFSEKATQKVAAAVKNISKTMQQLSAEQRAAVFADAPVLEMFLNEDGSIKEGFDYATNMTIRKNAEATKNETKRAEFEAKARAALSGKVHDKQELSRMVDTLTKINAGETVSNAELRRIANNQNALNFLEKNVLGVRHKAGEVTVKELRKEISSKQDSATRLSSENILATASAFFNMDEVGERSLMVSYATDLRNSEDGKIADPEVYAAAYNRVYSAGKKGADVSKIIGNVSSILSDSAIAQAYRAGQNAAGYKNSQQGLQNGSQSGTISTENMEAQNEQELHLRDSGERNDSKNSRGQVSAVEGNARQNKGRGEGRTGPRDSEASSLSYDREVSAKSLVKGGLESSKVRIVAEGSETESMKEARKIAESRGLKVVFFGGGNLKVLEGTKIISARAYIQGDTVYVRVDHAGFAADQLMKHEAAHDMIDKGEINVADVKKLISERFTPEEIDAVINSYAIAYEDAGMTANKIWVEIICDSVAEMNSFEGTDFTTAAEMAADFLPDLKEAVLESKKESRGPPKSVEGKASIEMDVESTDYKINTSMTMAEAKRMIETAYKVNGIAEYYEGEYRDAEDWLKKAGSSEVEMYIENDYDLQAKYINSNDDILNEEYTIRDVLEAYLAGTLVGKEKPKPKRLDVSQSTKLQDDRFYSPQKIEDAKALFDLANQKAVGKDAGAINRARAEILLFAHNKGAAELLGVTQAELNKKLRGWSGYSTTAKNISERINAGVAEENRWTGIENSAYINKAKVTNEDIERLVASVDGDSKGYERKYIARVMLAADTHIDYSGLKFKFASSQQVNADNRSGGRVLGFYDDTNRQIEVTHDKPHTVAHEMGHYIDAQWGRDLIGSSSSHLFLTMGVNSDMVRDRYGESGVQFLNNFKLFINSLSDVNQTYNSYYNDRKEIFARFFARFVEWTDNIATGNKYYSYESTMYGDKFTQAQYIEFARLLQEKALLDGMVSNSREDLSEPRTPAESEIMRSIKYANGNAVVWIEDDVLKGNKLPVHQAVANYLVHHIGDVYTIIESGQKVYLGKNLPSEYTQSEYTKKLLKKPGILKAKNKALPNLGEMIEIATNRRWAKDKGSGKKDAKYGVYKYDTRFAFPVLDSKGNKVRAKAYDATLVIINSSDGKKYLYDLVTIKENTSVSVELSARESIPAQEQVQKESVSTISIPQKSDLSTPDAKKVSKDDGHASIDLTSMDADYMSAVERGDMETAQRMVDEAAKKAGYDDDAYHGTNQGDFNRFEWNKTQRADGGFFGRGHYFTKSEGMAKLYGKRIVKAKLKLGKTFVWSEEINSYKGKRPPELLSRNIVSRINMAKMFPDIFANQTMSYWEYDTKKGENVEKTIKWDELEDIVNDLSQGLTLRAYADGTYKWHTEGRFWEVPVGESYSSVVEANEGKFFAAINALKEKYDGLLSSMSFDDQTTYTQQYGTEITEALKKMGYSSAMDTAEGSEIVVFDSNQIKSADPVTYDDNGKVIPISERFNPDNDDIRFSYDLESMDEDITAEENVSELSDRERLAAMFESEDMSPSQKGLLTKYKNKLSDIEANEAKIAEMTEELDALKKNGKGNTAKAAVLENKIRTLEKQNAVSEGIILNIEAAKPIKRLLERERRAAYQEGLLAGQMAQGKDDAPKLRKTEEELATQKQKSKTDLAEYKRLAAQREGEALLAGQMAQGRKDAEILRKTEEELAATKQKSKDELAKLRQKRKDDLDALAKRYQESRAKSVEGRRKTKMKENIRKVVKDINTLLKKNDKKNNVKQEQQTAVATSLALAEVLFNDNIRNEDIVRLGVDSVTTAESVLLNDYRDLLDERDATIAKIDSIYANGIVQENLIEQVESIDKALTKINNRISVLNSKLSDVFERERTRLNKSTINGVFDALITEYSKLANSEKQYIKNAYREVVKTRLESLKMDLDGKTAKDMDIYQLTEVYDTFKAIKHMISTSNNIFREGRTEDLETYVSDTQKEMFESTTEPKDRGEFVNAISNVLSEFSWNNLRPVDAVERLGSKTFEKLFWDYVAGMGVAARDVVEARDVIANAREKYGYSKWNLKIADATYTTRDGLKFKPTLADKLSIYAYSKREKADGTKQAMGHMVEGGFTYDTGETYKDVEAGKTYVRRKLSTTYRLSEGNIKSIINSLTQEQRAYVDAILPYLTDMGKKGNEVSMILCGIELFGDKIYFPLQSSSDYLNSTTQELGTTKTMSSLANSGFTKQTNPNADNPIVLRGFDDVVLEHIEKMSNYHGLAIPIENLRRVFDNVSRDADRNSLSTKALIGSRYGMAAQKYFAQMLTDFNGGISPSGAKSLFSKLFSGGKAMAVSANLSVVAQQYFSIIRAMEIVNPKYFMPFLNSEARKSDMKQYEELLQHVPIAIIKEMNGFDVGSSGRVKDYIGYEGARKDAKYIRKTIDDVAMWGAGQMDKFGWVTIWKAIKAEVASEQKLTPGTKAFFDACEKRATEVITKTQVYDSIASRSGYMRSSSDAVKYATSFMGEPTVIMGRYFVNTINLVRAVKSKNKGKVNKAFTGWVRAAAVMTVSQVLSNLAKSLIYAGRDDEEDEAFLEKWMKNFAQALVSDLNLFNSLPFTRDIMSIIEGWDVERPDLTLIADAIISVKKFRDGITVDEAINLIGALGNLAGIPFKNLIREVNSLRNAFDDIVLDDINPTDVGGAFVEGITGKERTKQTNLYNAIISGDTGKIEAIKGTYKTKEAYESAVRSALRDNDPRIKEAAKALISGDIRVYNDIVNSIASEGYFEAEMVESAIRAEQSAFNTKVNKAAEAKNNGDETEYKKLVKELLESYEGVYSQDEIVGFIETAQSKQLEEGNNEDTEEATSIFKTTDVIMAFEFGDSEMAVAAIEDLFNTKVENYIAEARREAKEKGKKFDEAAARKEAEEEVRTTLRSSLTKHYKPLYYSAYLKGDRKEMERIRKILITSKLYVYKTRKDVDDVLEEWIESYDED